MPNDYLSEVQRLTKQLGISQNLMSFLNKAYVDSLPVVGRSEDERFNYIYLALPSRQIKRQGRSDTTLGKTILAGIDKATGQLYIKGGDFNCDSSSLSNPSLKSIIAESRSISNVTNRIQFEKELYNGYVKADISEPLFQRLESVSLKTIGSAYRDDDYVGDDINHTLKFYFDAEDVTNINHYQHSFPVSDLFTPSFSELTSNKVISNQLFSLFKNEARNTCQNFIDTIKNECSPHIDDLVDYNPNNYNLYEQNFILGGKGDAKQYRKEFIDQCHQLLDEPSFNSDNKSITQIKGVSPQILHGFYRSLIGTNTDIFRKSLTSIDAGLFPLSVISEANKRNNLTKKQLKSSIKDWRTLASESPINANARALGFLIQFSSIPSNWLIKPQENYRVSELIASQRYSFISSSMLACANKIDSFKNTNDKNGLKQLAREWTWLSKKGEDSISDKYKSLIAKYSGDTISDYTEILNTLVSAVQLRVFSEDAQYFSKAFELNTTSMDVIAKSNLTKCAKEVYESKIKTTQSAVSNIQNGNPIDEVEFSEYAYFGIENSLIENSSLLYFYRGNEGLHKNISNIYSELSGYHTENISWTPFINAKYSKGDIHIEPIADRHELNMDGIIMKHCVSSYLARCFKGESYILSVRESGLRVATLELSTDDLGDGLYDVTIVQVRGVGNSEVPEYIKEVVDEFVKDIETNSIEYNVEVEVNNQSLISKCEVGGIAHYGHMRTIPYHTDAAYLAFHYLETHLKKYHKTVSGDNLLKACGLDFIELYRVSDFRKNYELIKSLSDNLNVSPDILIETKHASQLETFDEAAEVLKEYSKIADSITELSSSVPTGSTAMDVCKIVNVGLLNNYNVYVPAETLLNFDVGNPLTELTNYLNNELLTSPVASNKSPEIKLSRKQNLSQSQNQNQKMAMAL
ncbi:MAG: hypothetical protein HAW67_05995 [Endozoicomonadaceae bacterium]|nr:hypothetical protein [Endozoicomonadaceae bacterium]